MVTAKSDTIFCYIKVSEMADIEENLRRQLEEIEALSSIYEDNLVIDSETSLTILIKEPCGNVTLSVNFPPEYPSSAPPTYQKSAPFLRGEEKLALCDKLDDIYVENLGESLVYLWVEEIRSYLQEREDSQMEQNETTDHTVIVQPVEVVRDLSSCPEIVTGDVLEDRRSVFQGHVAVVNSVNDVELVLMKLKQNKKIAHATHNMYAYRIYNEEKSVWHQDCDDDGEDAAGGRLMHLLEILDSKNLLVVVSRWYGGILLGPDRFKHINNAARQVIEAAGLIENKDDKSKKKKNK